VAEQYVASIVDFGTKLFVKESFEAPCGYGASKDFSKAILFATEDEAVQVWDSVGNPSSFTIDRVIWEGPHSARLVKVWPVDALTRLVNSV
jgi:hypothetical protein